MPVDDAENRCGPDDAPAWRKLADTLLGDHRLADRIGDTIRARVPAYRLIPADTLGVEVENVLRCARRGGTPSADGKRDDLTVTGETQARQGIAIDDVVRAWRIGVEVLVVAARELAPTLGVDDVAVLEFVQSVLVWSDAAMAATAGAYRRVDVSQAAAAEEGRARFVRGVLLGAIPRGELRIHAEMYGLDATGRYVAVRARLDPDVSLRQLERELGFRDPARGRTGLCALVDGDLAGFLVEPPPGNLDGMVGVGPPRTLEQLTESYRLAARALLTAEACSLRGVYDVASLGLRSAVALDSEMGELLRRRYLEPLTAGGSADDLIATLRAYLACGMRVESTATRLFVHQNTVRYRLARFEELTGASLRETEVLIELWWALELSAMRL